MDRIQKQNGSSTYSITVQTEVVLAVVMGCICILGLILLGYTFIQSTVLGGLVIISLALLVAELFIIGVLLYASIEILWYGIQMFL